MPTEDGVTVLGIEASSLVSSLCIESGVESCVELVEARAQAPITQKVQDVVPASLALYLV